MWFNIITDESHERYWRLSDPCPDKRHSRDRFRGRINPDYFLGGEIPLNVCLAKKAIIPTDPAVFSAWDMLVTDLRQDFIKTFIVQTDQVELKK